MCCALYAMCGIHLVCFNPSELPKGLWSDSRLIYTDVSVWKKNNASIKHLNFVGIYVWAWKRRHSSGRRNLCIVIKENGTNGIGIGREKNANIDLSGFSLFGYYYVKLDEGRTEMCAQHGKLYKYTNRLWIYSLSNVRCVCVCTLWSVVFEWMHIRSFIQRL